MSPPPKNSTGDPPLGTDPLDPEAKPEDCTNEFALGGQFLLDELRELPRRVWDHMVELFRRGYPSTFVTEYLLSEGLRGDIHTEYGPLIHRVEYLRRHMPLHPEAQRKREQETQRVAKDRQARETHSAVPDASSGQRTLTEPSETGDERDVTLPKLSATKIPNPSKFQYKREQTQTLLAEVRQLPGVLLDIVTGLLITGETSEMVTELILRRPDRGGLAHMQVQDLLYHVEFLRRHVSWLKGNWDNDQGSSATDPDVLANYVRRKVRGDPPQGIAPQGAAATSRRRTMLLSYLAQIPDPLFGQFSRLLVEGGTIADRVLRKAAELNREETLARGGADCKPAGKKTRQRKKRDAQDSCESTYRAQKGDSMLRTLGKLRPSLLQEAIRLLWHGAKATVVSRFLLSHPDLGLCPRLSDSSMRQYVQHLRRKVLEEREPPAARKRFLHQLAKHIQRHQVRSRNVLLIRRNLDFGEENENRISSVPEVESLASIKASLMELFGSDPSDVLQELTALRRPEVQTSGAS